MILLILLASTAHTLLLQHTAAVNMALATTDWLDIFSMILLTLHDLNLHVLYTASIPVHVVQMCFQILVVLRSVHIYPWMEILGVWGVVMGLRTSAGGRLGVVGEIQGVKGEQIWAAPCGASVLFTTVSDMQLCSLTY